MSADVSTHPAFYQFQHCQSDVCEYTFAHTASLCSQPQSRFCECAFDYAAGVAAFYNAEVTA